MNLSRFSEFTERVESAWLGKTGGYRHRMWLLDLFWLAAQAGLIWYTAVTLPRRAAPKWFLYGLYTCSMFLVWMAYAMIAMFFDSWRRADIPGFGYLVLGFMAWMVGSVIFMVKAIRADLANPVDE